MTEHFTAAPSVIDLEFVPVCVVFKKKKTTITRAKR